MRKQEAATQDLLAQQERRQRELLEAAIREIRGEMERRLADGDALRQGQVPGR